MRIITYLLVFVSLIIIQVGLSFIFSTLVHAEDLIFFVYASIDLSYFLILAFFFFFEKKKLKYKFPGKDNLLIILGILLLFGVYTEITREITNDFLIRCFQDYYYHFRILIFVPIFEELIFRLYFFEGFKGALGNIGSIILSSALFTLVHLDFEIFNLIFIFFSGVLFCIIYARTKILALPIILHIGFNMIYTFNGESELGTVYFNYTYIFIFFLLSFLFITQMKITESGR